MSEVSERVIVEAMVGGRTRGAIALGLSISEGELRHVLERPAILIAIAEAQADVQRQLLGRLRITAARAVDVLDELLITGSDAHRLQAARLVLDQWVLQRGIYEETLLDLAEAAGGDTLPVVEEGDRD